MNKLTQDILKEILEYHADSGVFYWKIRTNSRCKAGDIAGGKRPDGYIRIGIEGRRYLAHRLAWLYMQGEWPKDQIDHINHTKDDNRAVNLREATHQQNLYNQRKRKNNTSGFKGVYWHTKNKNWIARINISGVRTHIGVYKKKEDAAAAYNKAAEQLHGEFIHTEKI